MSKFDRYVLSQYLLFFGFFSLILVAVFWLNQAVILFDVLVGDGQNALVFLEFTALALPRLIRMILPMAAFAAVLYFTNRLSNESELTVMKATGASPWQMARPAFWFGASVALMMAVLTNFLLPASTSRLSVREAEISQNIAARLLTEGTFLHPTDGVTFYIREIGLDGALNDVFLSDRRDPEQTMLFTAARAFLVREDGGARLIMVDGMAQGLETERQALSITYFEDFSYDISALMPSGVAGARSHRAIPTLELLTSRDRISAEEGISMGTLTEELHVRFTRPLNCLAVAMLGFSTLLLGGFSRFGLWRQMVGAFFLLVLLETLRGTVSPPVEANPAIWPLLYLPPGLALGLSAVFLYISGRAGRLSRKSPGVAA
ncbi:LPS export ABC transporter permease LptF [Marinibacterium profundimaris]|uniref:Permease n=1 Tax=Marinibacterium profundimaris TaxID=1679460 RepID=A0A225NS74_9RHOB|nr:LPS export ABC transporter permease LptF [Marinibacterium profundimaris]OWU77771.1 permease [Marinibacterium profundimaris]